MTNDLTDPMGRPVTMPDGVDPDAVQAMSDRHAALMAPTPCGPLCDSQHMVNEPHNRNRAPMQPDDHTPKQDHQADEAMDRELTFDWDGESWTFKASAMTSMELFAALADADGDDGFDPIEFTKAMRIMLGREQAARLFKGRNVNAVQHFFDAAGKAVGSGNR